MIKTNISVEGLTLKEPEWSLCVKRLQQCLFCCTSLLLHYVHYIHTMLYLL